MRSESKKILVADDSPTISMMVASVLENAGYQVVTAFDGLETLEKVYQTFPDLIVLDILMPKMNGYQVCRLLKHDQQTSFIPIIMLSAKAEQKDKFWGLYTGADSYLTKNKNIAKTLLPEIEKTFARQNAETRTKPLSLPRFNQEELIQRLNNLLDDMLFDSVLINEIQDKSQAISDFTVLNKELFVFLGKVIKFQLGVLYLVEENCGSLVSYLPAQSLTTKRVMAELDKALRGKQLPSPQDLQDFTFNIFPEPSSEASDPGPPEDLLVEEVNIRGAFRGLLLLQRYEKKKFSEEEKNTLKFFLKHASGLLDNAFLYHKTQQLAITDGLTKLYNHRYFQDALEDELNRSRRFRRPLSLIMIDIDHFKHFNDTYGHQQGDIILKELACLLRENVRKIEIVARYGGEEFAIILPETSDAEAAEIAERLRNEVAKKDFTFKKRNGREQITISLGIATFPNDADNQVALIRSADKALYLAKESGRNRVCFLKKPADSN